MSDKNYYDYSDKFSLLAEWFDNDIAFHKKFLLYFFPCDDSLELYDRDLNRIYLRRSKCEGISLDDLFIGNTLRIYGKQLYITDYADKKSRDLIGKLKEHTILLIKPSAMDKLGQVIQHLEKENFFILKMRMCLLSRKEALEFYVMEKGDPFLPFKIEHLVSGNFIALEIVGEDAVSRALKLLGDVDPEVARQKEPNSFRALYAKTRVANGFFSSKDAEHVIHDACFFFPRGIDKKPPQPTCRYENSTCCIIKPHAIKEGKLGPILTYILDSKFEISALQMFHLSDTTAEEFLEVYKGVVHNFHALMSSLVDGPCVVLEISGKDPNMNVHEEFRKFAGPYEPEIAKQIRPQTIRAAFGDDKYQNAIHCTDLLEDTNLELEYFFKILDNNN